MCLYGLAVNAFLAVICSGPEMALGDCRIGQQPDSLGPLWKSMLPDRRPAERPPTPPILKQSAQPKDRNPLGAVRVCQQEHTLQHRGSRPTSALVRGRISYICVNRADRHSPRRERNAAGRLEPDRSRTCIVRIREPLLGDCHDARVSRPPRT
jgi:hypothetical protein